MSESESADQESVEPSAEGMAELIASPVEEMLQSESQNGPTLELTTDLSKPERKSDVVHKPLITEELGWTGGQYSLWRTVFGLTWMGYFLWFWPVRNQLAVVRNLDDLPDNPLFLVFPNLLTIYPSPHVAGACLLLAAGFSALLALGWGSKPAAVGVWYLWTCFYVQQPQLLGSAWPFLSWLLLAQVCIAAAPFGSWAARGRVDPRGGWTMSSAVYVAAWVVLSATFAYQAWVRWELFTSSPQVSLLNWPTQRLIRAGSLTGLGEFLPIWVPNLLMCLIWGVEASFALLAIFRPLRPWLWTIAVVLQLLAALCFDMGFLGWAYFLLLGFTFNPAWLPGVKQNSQDSAYDRIYYDGGCGLCHRTIRWVLSEDRHGRAFRLAPLDSDSFRTRTTEEQRAQLPDSVIVLTADGLLLSRASAILRLLSRLGGYWRILGWLACVFPRSLLDVTYDLVARFRHRLFRKPSTACPILPPDLRERFEY